MLFLYDNLIDNPYVTLTASSEAAGFPASNLKNPFRSKCWLPSAAPASLVVDMTALWQAATGSDLLDGSGSGEDTSGWSLVDCTNASVAGGVAGNCFSITRTGGTLQGIRRSIATVIGKMYKLTAYVKSGTSGNEAYALQVDEADGSNVQSVAGTSSGSWVQATLYFTATDTTTRVMVKKNTATAGTMLFDSIEVFEMAPANGYPAAGIDGIALTGYGWGVAPGTLQIEFNDYDVWTSPVDTETLTWNQLYTPGYNKGSIIKKLAYGHYFRYARLNVSDAEYLGRLFLGPVFEPARTYSWGYREEIIDPSIISGTIGGQDHADEMENYRLATCNGIILTQAQWVLYQAMINTVGRTRPFFFAADYVNEAAERTIYGTFDKLPGVTRPYLYEYDFQIREAR